MKGYKQTKFKFIINKVKHQVYLTPNSKYVVFVDGKKRYVDMTKHPLMPGGTTKRSREEPPSTAVPRKAPTYPSKMNYSGMPEEMKTMIFDAYVNLVREDMSKLNELNKSIPSKKNVSNLMDKLIAVYNNIQVCKDNANRMGASKTNSLDDFVDYMQDLYFYTDNTPLHFMHTLGSDFEDIVVTYAKPNASTKSSTMVRIHVEPKDMASRQYELEHTVTLMKTDRSRMKLDQKVVQNDLTDANLRELFKKMSNLQLIKRIYHLLYVGVPTELGLGQSFYIESIYKSCLVNYEEMNRWEYEGDSNCAVHTELGHANLQRDPEEDFTTTPFFVYSV
jgi:acyl-CoA hydrolase